MENNVKIEKGIPFPKKQHYNYPLDKMETGDSFHIDALTKKEKKYFQIIILRIIKMWMFENNKSWKFVTKSDDTGVRIWRLK